MKIKRNAILIAASVLIIGAVNAAALGSDSGNIDIFKITSSDKAGDLNFDSSVDAEDLSLMRKSLLNVNSFDEVLYDVNNDDSVDIRDLVRIKKISAEAAE